jgi:hypothetical protein
MADLVVDLSLLESTAGSLGMLVEEFSNATKIVTSHETVVGEPQLVAALQAFSGDWRAHREELVSSMNAVYQMATKSHKAYIDTDNKLAQDLRKDGQG